MDIKQMIQFIKNTDGRRLKFQKQYEISKRYYFNQNDITLKNEGVSKTEIEAKEDKNNPLRHADNRVSANFHQILVDQKADYVASVAPAIDVGDDELNEQIQKALGDDFASILNQLVVDSSNAGIGWLHVWHDRKDGHLRFAVIPPDQITPLYSGDTDKTLLAVRRTYAEIDPETGKQFTATEYWDNKSGTVYKSTKSDYEDLEELKKFAVIDVSTSEVTGHTATVNHDFGVVPFIPFYNNKFSKPDLDKYKGYIDIYDQVYNGFANDVADVQQVILVLTNYGGVNLDKFMKDLREKHAVKMDSAMPEDKSGLSTLTIDIPVEARKTVLELTFDDIFTFGQGVNPNKLDLGNGNSSGVALKMMYANLELKGHTVEAWFRNGVAELVRIILNELGASQDLTITQTWKRASIQNDVEKADEVSKLADYTSKTTIAKTNPLVEDWKDELKQLEQEADDEAKRPDVFVPKSLKDDSVDNDDE